jgi:hypothetical protein
MSPEPTANTESDKRRQDDARTAYQVAASLYMQENAVTWARFSIMVVASSIIVAATGTAARPGNQLYLLAIFLPIAGLILCVIWCMMTKRGFDYHDHWREYARDLEKNFCSETIQTLQKADQKFRPSAPGLRARYYAYGVIFLFGVLYSLAILILLYDEQWVLDTPARHSVCQYVYHS